MFIFFAAILVVADQATKYWASKTFPLDGFGQSLGFGLHFTYVQNSGAAFGILQSGTLALGILSAIVSLFIFLFLLRGAAKTPILQRFALALILAGAMGNMIDRFRLGYVTDFIHFRLPNFNFPVFNLADSCVVIGAALLILSSLFRKKPDVEMAIASASSAHDLEPVRDQADAELDSLVTPVKD